MRSLCVVGKIKDGLDGGRPNDVINVADQEEVDSLKHDFLSKEDVVGGWSGELPAVAMGVASYAQRQHRGQAGGCDLRGEVARSSDFL